MAKYFTKSEFTCHCGCGTNLVSDRLTLGLDRARGFADIPFVINSGTRCEIHNGNPEVGGSPTSSHLTGEAADIRAETPAKRFKVVQGLLRAGFRRIIIYRDKGIIHTDISEDKAQDIISIY